MCIFKGIIKYVNQIPLLGNMGKYTASRAGPIQTFPVLGQLFWAYVFPCCPNEDSGVAALTFHHGVSHRNHSP